MAEISIVIPYYNDSVMVVKCIDSIHRAVLKLPEAKQGIQVIVIDDHSPVPFSFPSSPLALTCFRLDENKGVGTARNKGAELAKGDYILFIDSDVMLDENHLCLLYDEIEQNKSLKILQGPTGVAPANESADFFQHYLAAAWHYYEEQNWRITVFTQCVLVKKDFFIRMGGFVEKFSRSGGEEFEFALRLGFIKGSNISYKRNLVHYHHFDKIKKRLKKVYFRSRYISSIALGMSNLPLRFKVQAIMRSLYSQLLNLCLLVCVLAPLKGMALYILIGTLFYFSDWRFSKHMIEKKSCSLSILSVFFRQAEYSFINLGMLAGFLKKA